MNEVIGNIDPKPGGDLVDERSEEEGIRKRFSKDVAWRKASRNRLWQRSACWGKEKLSDFSGRIFLERGNYATLNYCKNNNFEPINIFFPRSGHIVASLDDENLGISFWGITAGYEAWGPMITRVTADDAENILTIGKEEEIEEILKKYGEERYAKLITREIAARRKEHRIVNTSQLVADHRTSSAGRYKGQKYTSLPEHSRLWELP